jgi:hypothetical protein
VSNKLTVRVKTLGDLEEQMPRATLQLCDWTREILDRSVERTLRDIWEVGRRHREAEQKPTEYGNNSVELVERRLDLDRGTIRQAIRFHQMFDKPALDKLAALRLASSGRALSWSHIAQVLHMNTSKQAMAVLTRAAKEGWSREDLLNHLQKARENAPHAGGRPLKIPANLSGKLANLEKVLSIVSRNHKEIWANKDAGILRAVEDMPPDKVDQSTVGELARALAVARNAKDAMEQDIELLQKAHDLAATRYSKQAKEHATATVAGM